MQGPSVHLSDDDELVDLHTSSSFKIPPTGASGPNLGTDMLINRRKVSNEVMSLSSSSRSSSESSGSPRDTPMPRVSSTPLPQRPSSNIYKNVPINSAPKSTSFNNNYSNNSNNNNNNNNDSDSDNESEDNDEDNQDAFGNRFRTERSRLESEMEEKKEILYQMDRLESKGYKLPRNFSMQSDLEEMRAEYHRIVREKEIDASIRFQRKAMMFLVSGVEFMNTKFDPISAKLDGWSEQVHDKITDYDDIFEELHEKYKGTGQQMAPELRLLLGVGGSAFMYHLTQSMFKQSKTTLPGVEEVLKSNPELMKQFQNAALNQMQQQEAQQKASESNSGGMGGGLFSMFGNMMNLSGLGGGNGPPMPQMTRPGKPVRQADDIDDIIDGIHAEINEPMSQGQSQSQNIRVMNKPDKRVETMSVSDEEITSIIEDTADLNGIMLNSEGAPRRGRPSKNKNTRTLNL
jgi:hypothetical protein